MAVDCGVGAGNGFSGSFCVSKASAATKAAVVSLVAILVNSLYIVPRALEAGKKATKPTEKSKTVADFAVSGGFEDRHQGPPPIRGGICSRTRCQCGTVPSKGRLVYQCSHQKRKVENHQTELTRDP
jgi:hypothetical protein